MEATQTQLTNQAQTDEQAQAQTDEKPKRKFNEVDLSDGRVATVRRPKGRDIRDAGRLVPGGNEMELGMAMASVATSINGEPVNYDDFLELELEDCYAIVNKYQAMTGKK